MSKIELSFQVGFVSAFFFIIFDLVLLTIVDIVLSRVVCRLYYRKINAGQPLNIRSADVPGITTFLVGRFASLSNIFAILLKLAFLVCIVFIEQEIDSEKVEKYTQVPRMGTFIFNASNAIWEPQDHRAVSRRWELTRQCRHRNEIDNTLTFYQIAFNFDNDRDVENEVLANSDLVYEVNDSTITCLSPQFVTAKHVKSYIRVVGCSQLVRTSCDSETVIRRNGNLTRPILTKTAKVEAGAGTITLVVVTFSSNDELGSLFPEIVNDPQNYSNPEFTCATTRIGIGLERSKIFTSCLLIVNYRNDTLIERWTYDFNTSIATRSFPGPVFEGNIDFGTILRYSNLRKTMMTGSNSETFASVLVADAMIYQRFNESVREFDLVIMTTIPRYAVILGFSLLGFVIVVRIIVVFTIGRDERPQLNSVDGLSSIAREEHEPSGRSLVAGRGIMVGLSHRDPKRMLHFGPLRLKEESAKRSASEDVE